MIDNAKSADFLATLIVGLPDGPVKERAKARIAELKKTQVANLAPEPPKPAPTPTSAERRYVLPEGAAVVPRLGHAGSVEAVAFSPDGRSSPPEARRHPQALGRRHRRAAENLHRT